MAEKRRTSRADSAFEPKDSMNTVSVIGDRRGSNSSGNHSRASKPSSRPATSAGRTQVAASQSREDSSQQRSRSHSQKTKRRRPMTQRGYTSPVPTWTSRSIENATAFHERSCQIMSMCGDLGLANPTSEHTRLLSARPSPTGSIIDSPMHNELEAKESDGSTDDAAEQREPVRHWTSTTTRRKEYAEIDKRNTCLRKLMRMLVPGCIRSKKAALSGFYGEEDDVSDCGSVRRYRLELPEDEKC